MAVWIREQGYEPQTSIENVISMIFAFYATEVEENMSEFDTESGDFSGTYVEACQAFVQASGGIEEFDYEP